MKQFIEKLRNKQDLSFQESKQVFGVLMDGKANDQEIFDFLTLLSSKGETSDEIAGGVYVLRQKSKRVNINNCVDTCGTGGDGMNTLNISTASALLLASMGVKIAKHGNKAVSSKCGSGDVLEALNVKINLEPNDIENQIKKNNFGFMFAPNYHSAMKFVGPTRKKIGKRTIFNMIGPLSSPALEKSLSSPLKIFIILSELNFASPPIRFSNLSAFILNSFGSIMISEILLFFNCIIFVFA